MAKRTRRWIPRDPWQPDTDSTPFRDAQGKLKTRSKAYRDHIAAEKRKDEEKNKKKDVKEEAPTNSMGVSSSTTGPIVTYDPLLKKRKNKKLDPFSVFTRKKGKDDVS